MNRTLTMLILLVTSGLVFGQSEKQNINLDKLLDRYETQQRSMVSEDPEFEIRKLRNQIIDLKVEKDTLVKENAYLRNKIETVETFKVGSRKCLHTDCIPVTTVENERIYSFVIYSLSLYRLAETITITIADENNVSRKKALKIMNSVKSDLNVLGFDTTDMHNYPSLDEILDDTQELKMNLTQ